MLDQNGLVRLSKRVSYALRHDPESFGLELSSDGSVDVDVLIDDQGILRAYGEDRDRKAIDRAT